MTQLAEDERCLFCNKKMARSKGPAGLYVYCMGIHNDHRLAMNTYNDPKEIETYRFFISKHNFIKDYLESKQVSYTPSKFWIIIDFDSYADIQNFSTEIKAMSDMIKNFRLLL